MTPVDLEREAHGCDVSRHFIEETAPRRGGVLAHQVVARIAEHLLYRLAGRDSQEHGGAWSASTGPAGAASVMPGSFPVQPAVHSSRAMGMESIFRLGNRFWYSCQASTAHFTRFGNRRARSMGESSEGSQSCSGYRNIGSPAGRGVRRSRPGGPKRARRPKVQSTLGSPNWATGLP